MDKIIVLLVAMNFVGLFYYLFCPKKKNVFFGYRTQQSMTSDAAFAFANKLASVLIFRFSIASTIINAVLLSVGIINLNLAVFIAISFLFIPIAITENRLSKFLRKQ